jgi:hypothetical protein
MSAYAVKEARIVKETRPEANVCGWCGVEIDDTRYVCDVCEHAGVDNESGEPI